MTTKQLKKAPWVFRLGIVLFCMMLMTTHLTGNLYARYSTTASGSDSARVAKFSVTDTWLQNGASVESFAVSLAPGEQESYTVYIENKGEVTVQYSIKIVNETKNLPIGDTIAKSGILDPGKNETVEFLIRWPKANGTTDVSYAGQMDMLQILFTIEQVD